MYIYIVEWDVGNNFNEGKKKGTTIVLSEVLWGALCDSSEVTTQQPPLSLLSLSPSRGGTTINKKKLKKKREREVQMATSTNISSNWWPRIILTSMFKSFIWIKFKIFYFLKLSKILNIDQMINTFIYNIHIKNLKYTTMLIIH